MQRLNKDVVIGIAIVLAGCGAPERSTPAVPPSSTRAVMQPSADAAAESSTQDRSSAIRPLDPGVHMIATRPAFSDVTLVQGEAESSPFELVGTTITAGKAFAVLKEADQSRVTVREGDRVDGYVIAAIAPDRVTVISSDNRARFLMLVPAEAAATPRAPDIASESVAKVGLIADGINTDQSMPEHVTFGPTARLPEGMKQMGH